MLGDVPLMHISEWINELLAVLEDECEHAVRVIAIIGPELAFPVRKRLEKVPIPAERGVTIEPAYAAADGVVGQKLIQAIPICPAHGQK